MGKIKLGAQLYTLRDYIKTYEDCEATFKYLNDIALKPSDVKANLNNNKQMTEIMDIVKYIHPINPLSEHNEISGFSGNLNNLTIHFDTDK